MSTGVPSSKERHVLLRNDLRDDALVAVAAGHLVAGLDLALHRDEDLDHLHHAGRQFVAALQLLDLVEEAALEPLLRLVVLLPHGFDLAHHACRRSIAKVHHCERGYSSITVLGENLVSFLKPFGPADGVLARVSRLLRRAIDVAVEDRQFVVAVLGETLDLLALDRLGALILLRRRGG